LLAKKTTKKLTVAIKNKYQLMLEQRRLLIDKQHSVPIDQNKNTKFVDKQHDTKLAKLRKAQYNNG